MKFPTDKQISRVTFVHLKVYQKQAGNWKIQGVKIEFGKGSEPLEIGNMKVFPSSCKKSEIVLEPGDRIVGFKFKKPQQKPFMYLQSGFAVLV